MKCSRCYKIIPAGEEIQKPAFFGLWWWGQEVLCDKCAKIRDQQKKWFLILAIGFIVVYLLVFLLTFLGVWVKISKIFKK